MRVLVTGAGGQTGAIVLRKLLERAGEVFAPCALVRSAASEAKLREGLGEELCKGLEVAIGDVTEPETLEAAFKGVDAVVIVTSAMPRLDKSSLPAVILTKIFTLGYVSRRPNFFFDYGQSPQEVDYMGQCSQIHLAKAAGVKHVVLVSSMAGTRPDHFLNTAMDNIVLWKRKAECHLVASGLPYTIVHPGGLMPHFGDKRPAPGGCRQLYAAVDDGLLESEDKLNLVPREDVAEVCVQCLLAPAGSQGRSFDLGSGPEMEKPPAVDVKELLASLGGKNCRYSEADATFSPPPQPKDRTCTCGAGT